MRRIVSIWFWAATALIAILWLVPLSLGRLLTVRRDPGLYHTGRCLRYAAIAAVALNPFWSFRTSGVRIRDPRRPYLVVANHESLADIFLLSHLPWEMKWLAKDELFRLPVMGWLMRLAGDIRVQRGNAKSRAEAFGQIHDRLRKRVSVMVFPEGTRSRTDRLLTFRDGAFRAAVEAGVPVLPVAIAGTRQAIRSGSLLLGRARAEVRVLEPIDTAGLTLQDVRPLRERVQTLIEATRTQLMRELDAAADSRARRAAVRPQ